MDARVDGGLLLELYSRDGVGTMISTDFYEGIRPASPMDADAIADLLAPLAAAGITRMRSREEIVSDLPHFTVVEREAKVGPVPSPILASQASLLPALHNAAVYGPAT